MACSAASRLSPNRRRESVAGSIKDTRAPRREKLLCRAWNSILAHFTSAIRKSSPVGISKPTDVGSAPGIAETGRGRSPSSRQNQPDLFSGAPENPWSARHRDANDNIFAPSPTMTIAAQSAHMCKRKTRKSRATRLRSSRRFLRVPSIESSGSVRLSRFGGRPPCEFGCYSRPAPFGLSKNSITTFSLREAESMLAFTSRRNPAMRPRNPGRDA
jgi:hypothetical protein